MHSQQALLDMIELDGDLPLNPRTQTRRKPRQKARFEGGGYGRLKSYAVAACLPATRPLVIALPMLLPAEGQL